MKTQTQTQEQTKPFSGATIQDPKSSGELSTFSQYDAVVEQISKVILHGDWSALSDRQKMDFYKSYCESLGLNPLARPVEFLDLGSGKDRKLVPYANKGCTEQLRKIHGISCDRVEHRKEDGLYFVVAHVVDKTGREDTATGVIPFVEPPTLKEWNKARNAYDFKPNPNAGKVIAPNELAVLIMKTETKAKRRATLSISGLGILDETEIESIPMEKNVTPAQPVAVADYKLEQKSNNLATKEQIEKANTLIKKLQKKEDYSDKVLMAKYGHKDITQASWEFMEDWIRKLEKQLTDVEAFNTEYDSAEAQA